MQTLSSGGALRLPFRFQQHRAASVDWPFLERRFTPRTVFMDIGAPDCALALKAATYVERVYAIDVSGHFVQNLLAPVNLRLVLCDGVRIPVPDACVDVAWSGAFTGHLHDEDLREHLKNVLRVLVPGGQYVCSSTRMREFCAAGFSAIRGYAGGWRVPLRFASHIVGIK
jgi:ubiquinone/menaquinone biosynthesis C-methylase UbiE